MSVRKAAYVLVLITTIGASYAAGYFTSERFIDDKIKKTAGSNETVNTATYLQNQKPVETIKNTTKIKQKITYSKGNTIVITTETNASNDIIGLNKDQAEKHFKQEGLIMVNFSDKEIVVTKDETDKWPPNYYIVKENKGLLTVYKSDENGNLKENPYETYDIKINDLMQSDKEVLTKGMLFENIEDVDGLVNDLSS